eukprot:1142646-Pelagomonas_calceolata.AAC.3
MDAPSLIPVCGHHAVAIQLPGNAVGAHFQLHRNSRATARDDIETTIAVNDCAPQSAMHQIGKMASNNGKLQVGHGTVGMSQAASLA